MRRVRRIALASLVVATGWLAPAAIAGAPARVASGTAGGVAPWVLTVSRRTLDGRLPALCVSLLWSGGPGLAPGNGFPDCLAPDQGYFVGRATRYRISLTVDGYHGVLPMVEEGGTPGFRGIAAIVGARATHVSVSFEDGSRVRMHEAPLPRALHLPFRIAWSTAIVALNDRTMTVRRIVAYDRHGRVVGSVRGDGPRH